MSPTGPAESIAHSSLWETLMQLLSWEAEPLMSCGSPPDKSPACISPGRTNRGHLNLSPFAP